MKPDKFIAGDTSDNSAVIFPRRPVLELYLRLNQDFGEITPALYALADEYRQWAINNPALHRLALQELLAPGKHYFTAHLLEAVEYLIKSTPPTCKDIRRRFDTWERTAILENDTAYFDALKFAPVTINELNDWERQAERAKDPAACRAAYHNAGRILAGLLNVAEPVL